MSRGFWLEYGDYDLIVGEWGFGLGDKGEFVVGGFEVGHRIARGNWHGFYIRGESLGETPALLNKAEVFFVGLEMLFAVNRATDELHNEVFGWGFYRTGGASAVVAFGLDSVIYNWIEHRVGRNIMIHDRGEDFGGGGKLVVQLSKKLPGHVIPPAIVELIADNAVGHVTVF